MAQITDFTAADAALDNLETAVATIEATAAGESQDDNVLYRRRYVRARMLAQRLACLTTSNGYTRIRRLVEA